MGSCFTREIDVDFDGPVDFDHFHILRAIGKGAFGKVCIVKKKDTKEMYAMKYMNKVQIIKKHAVENVFREVEILCQLEHPFLVNLWFTFQDQEDIFMVLDLMLGGDISYHLEKQGRFTVARVRLYVAELSLALEYLREHQVIHRDVKPANMLLDSGGHVHLTDFNVACIVRPGVAITSVTGTKPYMAPEVLNGHNSTGYSYAVDWWGMGVSVYEMLRGQRPFSIDRHMTNDEIVSNIRHTRPSASIRWDHQTCDLLRMLLHPDDSKRLQSVENMRKHRFFQDTDWDLVECKETTPVYIPAQNRIHCDPTHELEEMIVEPNPLHKKHHRLSRRAFRVEDETLVEELERMERRFSVYNRMRLKDAQRPTSEVADGQLQDSATDVESRESLDQKLEVDAVVDHQKRESRSSDGVTRGSPAPGKEASTPPQQEDEGGEMVAGERKEEEERERNSVPTDAAGDRESDRKLIASGGEKEGAGGGGEEESETVAGVTSEEKRDDVTVAPTPRDTTNNVAPTPRDTTTTAAPTPRDTTTTATIEIESTHKGAEGSEREPVKITPNNPAAPSEDAPISGSSSVEMGSPAHSDDGAHDDNSSPTQTDSPNPVERTDSMSSGALLLPQER